jgi:hypothetical protein
MPYDRYLQSRTTNTAQVMPNVIRHAILGGWLVSVAVIAAAMLAVLFPVGPSFYFQASRQEPALVTSSPGAVSAKGDRLITEKVRERREGGGETHSTSASTNVRNIPIGCDAAFSRLVKFGNFTARCVT